MQIKPTQISFHDYLCDRKEQIIEQWGLWRNAQWGDDAHREQVDEAYNEYIRTLDKLIESVLPY